MRPNLSIERLAVTLAALGTTTVVACTKAEPAAVRPEQTPSASASPPPPHVLEETKTEGEKEPAPTSIATATASARPVAQPPRHKAGTGQASCGAGTCTADPKKK